MTDTTPLAVVVEALDRCGIPYVLAVVDVLLAQVRGL